MLQLLSVPLSAAVDVEISRLWLVWLLQPRSISAFRLWLSTFDGECRLHPQSAVVFVVLVAGVRLADCDAEGVT